MLTPQVNLCVVMMSGHLLLEGVYFVLFSYDLLELTYSHQIFR